MRRALLSVLLVGCSAAPVPPAAPAPSKEMGLEIEAVSGLGLFADERVKSRALIAEKVGGAGVLPLEVTDRAWALAAEGKNPLTGASCGRPLARYQARRRWGTELGISGLVTSHVWCRADAGCELRVTRRALGEDDANDRASWHAPVSSSGAPLDALAAALPTLEPWQANQGGGGLGLLGSAGGPKPVQTEDLLVLRVWPADGRDRTRPPEGQQGFPSLTVGQVQTCLSGDNTGVTALVELSPAGALTRCEGDPSEEPAAAACICGQLQRSAPAAWLSGRRWTVTASVDRRDQLTSDGRLVLSSSWMTYLKRTSAPGEKFPRFEPKVEHPSIEAWSPGPLRLVTGCFASAFPEPGRLSTRWAVWFDGEGRPTKTLEQKGYPPLAKDVADCVARALRTSQAPCPVRSRLWAMADLHVSARDPNAPQTSLEDALKKQP